MEGVKGSTINSSSCGSLEKPIVLKEKEKEKKHQKFGIKLALESWQKGGRSEVSYGKGKKFPAAGRKTKRESCKMKRENWSMESDGG